MTKHADAKSPVAGFRRVVGEVDQVCRGGCCRDPAHLGRLPHREECDPVVRGGNLGFRLVMEIT